MTPRQLGELKEQDLESYTFLEQALAERNQRLTKQIKKIRNK